MVDLTKLTKAEQDALLALATLTKVSNDTLTALKNLPASTDPVTQAALDDIAAKLEAPVADATQAATDLSAAIQGLNNPPPAATGAPGSAAVAAPSAAPAKK